MDMLKFISYEKTRAECYRLLSACFYPPRKDVFDKEALLKKLAASLERIAPDSAAIALQMETVFLVCAEEELSAAYTKLFGAPFELTAPPYGSVYLDGEGRVLGDSTKKIAALYQDAGFSMDRQLRKLPDHITAELEFMCHLLVQQCESLERSDREETLRFLSIQEMFFNTYLAPWMQPFCERIGQGTISRFYKLLAGCLLAFVINECLGADRSCECFVKKP